jgi:phosphoenolpyruvate phosphomutase
MRTEDSVEGAFDSVLPDALMPYLMSHCGGTAVMEKARQLRELLRRPGAIVAVGAHDALSARLIERAGFDAVWASGFAISASQFALPDANVLTMTENLAVIKQMRMATELPIIADVDNGYGNAVNVMRTVSEYEAVGVAAISLEDNIFPKRCSFYSGVQRELVSLEEHCGKIRAAKRAQRSSDFMVIARTETLIAGWGMEEALQRATAYAEAGADAILIHSKAPTAAEVTEFARRWSLDTPLVVVPTTYASTPLSTLEAAGFKIVIFANHPVRAAITAMKDTLTLLRRDGTASLLDPHIAPLEEVYDLVGVSGLKAAEEEFLPVGAESVRAIILAAGFEAGLLPLIEDRPKALLDIKGKSILERQVEALNACNIKDIVVVRGYQRDKFTLPNIRYYDNERYEKSFDLASLFCAESELRGRCIVLYGDILFDRSVLEKLLQSEKDISLVVDRAWYDQHRLGTANEAPSKPDLVVLRDPPEQGYRFLPSPADTTVMKIGQQQPSGEAHGEFIGMAMFSPQGMEALRQGYQRVIGSYRGGPFHEAPSLEQASLTDMLQELIDQDQNVYAVNVYKGWMEVDTFEDYQRAWAYVKK